MQAGGLSAASPIALRCAAVSRCAALLCAQRIPMTGAPHHSASYRLFEQPTVDKKGFHTEQNNNLALFQKSVDTGPAGRAC